MPEVLVAVKNRLLPESEVCFKKSKNPADNRISWKEYKSVFKTILKSSGIGTFIGSLPGLGSRTAAFLAYGEAKRCSKDPDSYGKGSIEGIAAAESANNAVCGVNLNLSTISLTGIKHS